MARVDSKTPVGEWKEVCKGCHYRIAYNPGDIVSGRDDDDGSKYRYVSCPNCSRQRHLPDPDALDSSDYDC